MSDDKAKPTGAEIAKRLPEVAPNAQAALLFHLLETDSGTLDDVLANRDWIGGNSGTTGHGSGWNPEDKP